MMSSSRINYRAFESVATYNENWVKNTPVVREMAKEIHLQHDLMKMNKWNQISNIIEKDDSRINLRKEITG